MKIAALVLLAALSVVNGQVCQLVVPPRPLTAAGLATPYKLQFNATSTAGCTANNPMSLAFAHGVIIDTVTGALSVYNPLVITAGTVAAIQPKVPTLPANNVVGIWFGYNGGTLTIVDAPGSTSLADGNCVPGFNNNGVIDNFVQYAYCNGPAFYAAVKNMISAGKLVVPPLGNGPDNQVCPNVRSFDAVDQDPSDNVPTVYLVDGNNQRLAQFSAVNMGLLNNPTAVANPSDNIVITNFMMPAVGCGGSVWKVPDLVDNGNLVTALPLNEIQAEMFATKPQALVPLNHAFCLIGNDPNNPVLSHPKMNLYRAGVNQPAASVVVSATGTTIPTGEANPTLYCSNYNAKGGPRLAAFKALYLNAPSPLGGGQTLYAFLTNRFMTANQILGCANLIGNGNLFTNF